MTQIQRAGYSDVVERELFSLTLPDFQSLPSSISLPSRHFVALLAADVCGLDASVLELFSQRLLRAGCVYFCAWGVECERAHDIFDGECFEIDPVIMTTWHAKESLDEALGFFISAAFPDEGYAGTCRSGLAISIGRREWDEQIRRRLADPKKLIEEVV